MIIKYIITILEEYYDGSQLAQPRKDYLVKLLLKMLNDLYQSPFGLSPTQLLDHTLLYRFLDQLQCLEMKPRILTWLLIEKCVVHNNRFDLLESNIRYKIDSVTNANGTVMYPHSLIDPTLIRNIYLTNCQPLIDIFKKYLPIPPASIFTSSNAPAFILEQKQQKRACIMQLVERHPDHTALEKKIIMLQRITRSRTYYQQELKRLATRFRQENEKMAIDYLKAANVPYRPYRCNGFLATRIVSLAGKVTLFTKITHHTSSHYFKSIFDDGLYGRHSLTRQYMRFQPALSLYDTFPSDRDTISFAPQLLTHHAGRLDAKITLYIDKLQETRNRCVLYKQRDFNLAYDAIRTVLLGDKLLYFSHTIKPDPRYNDDTHLVIFSSIRRQGCGYLKQPPYEMQSDGPLISVTRMPKQFFMASNLKQMHQILTLNFFRFIDNLTDKYGETHHAYIQQFYNDLDALSDEALFDFLENLGKNFTDTMEFNFQGAHLIDFNSVASIEVNNSHVGSFSLDLPKLVAKLNEGNLSLLSKAKIHIPALFTSYRFLDYLINATEHSQALYVLHRLRSSCSTPFWLRDAHAQALPLTPRQLNAELDTAAAASSAAHSPRST